MSYRLIVTLKAVQDVTLKAVQKTRTATRTAARFHTLSYTRHISACCLSQAELSTLVAALTAGNLVSALEG